MIERLIATGLVVGILAVALYLVGQGADPTPFSEFGVEMDQIYTGTPPCERLFRARC